MTRLEVKVLQKHINAGKQGFLTSCAIAQVFNCDASVQEEVIEYAGLEFKVPVSVKNFITKFDNDKDSAHPFKFRLKVKGKDVKQVCKAIKGNPNLKLIMK